MLIMKSQQVGSDISIICQWTVNQTILKKNEWLSFLVTSYSCTVSFQVTSFLKAELNQNSVFIFKSIFLVLRIEPRASNMLGSTTELYLSSHPSL